MKALVPVVALIAAWAATWAAQAQPAIVVSEADGPDLTVQVAINNIGEQAVAGYQVILAYDPADFAFVSGQYHTGAFGLPLLNPISGLDGRIAIAAGINTFVGQPPVTADSVVATLRFQPLGESCRVELLIVPDSLPPTRLTDNSGQSISPLVLVSLTHDCPADHDGNGLIEVIDIFAFLVDWFDGSCRADADGGGLTVLDIFVFLEAWFSQCS